MKNFFSLPNILWWVIGGTISVTAIIKIIRTIWKIPSILKELLKGNRPSINNHAGKHYADRFIDIWYSVGKEKPYDGQYIGNAGQGTVRFSVIDFRLEELGLITRKKPKARTFFMPVESLRNRIIVFFIRMNLIYCKGDDKDYYKRLKRNRKRMKAKNKN